MFRINPFDVSYEKISDIKNIKLTNQHIWDRYPERAKNNALDAIQNGGFGSDCIDRRVGNYEGQIFAIEYGWVSQEDPRNNSLLLSSWVINDTGKSALKDNGYPVPSFLTALDTWHHSSFEYCLFTERSERDGLVLNFAEKLIPKAGRVGMNPKFRYQDVVALRDYLTSWIEEHKENKQD